ncbi:type II toxin-antitoxin system antitoxin SocA domain-containing protein [Terrimonas ferruginea]|uniref:type II toxin-antitoxin system antitoxin SocA domain-containing protein n=1 Tax=Terrimonas ferruginea TaxID=249 RepID=UPI0004281243|nr:type II toxin-antitoxin system antitoxin SocA domain-containing protein [Terrimonas ferruginea]
MSNKFDNSSVLKWESRTLTYRNEEYRVLFHFYVDGDTGEQYTTTELDELNLTQLHNLYRFRNGIPFIDEIKAIREQYGLSASKMSEVLGLAANVYKNYENGEMPSPATGRLIQLVKDPKEFKHLIDISRHKMEQNDINKLLNKVQSQLNNWNFEEKIFEHYLFGEINPSLFTGFRSPNLDKIGNMVKYFSYSLKPFTTKMNKLLFFADFLHFKKTGFSISGLCYKAIAYGPVPNNYGGLYDTLYDHGFMEREVVTFKNGEGEIFKSAAKEIAEDLFESTEMNVMNEVVKKMGHLSTNAIVNASHDEDAWISNVDEKDRVNYLYSFSLRSI